MLNWFDAYPDDQFVKRNFLANTFDGAIYTFAMSFISLSTVMPLFVKKIGGSNFAVALIPVLWTIGVNFPQIFVANFVRKKPYKKPLLLLTALFQRLPWLLLALFSLLLADKITSGIQVIIFFVLLGLAAIASSINLPGWFDLIAKVTPVKIRGRLFASRAVLGSLLGLFGGWLTNIILSEFSYPLGFTILFFLTFVIMMLSYILLFLIKETEPNPAKENFRYKAFFQRIPSLIINNKNYRNYLAADAFLIASLMADAFFAINAIEKFNLPDAYAGVFTLIIMGSIIAGNFLFGYMGDKMGHKINMWIASSSMAAACIIALLAPSAGYYFVVFIFSGFTATLIQVSRIGIIAEISSEDDRPTYVAVTNMITSPFILLGIAGGWIASSFGYNYLFAFAGSMALLSSALFYFKVKEPRLQSIN